MVITLSVPDQVATRVINALCVSGGYSTVNTTNAKTTLMDMITQMVQSVETRAAMTPPPPGGADHRPVLNPPIRHCDVWRPHARSGQHHRL